MNQVLSPPGRIVKGQVLVSKNYKKKREKISFWPRCWIGKIGQFDCQCPRVPRQKSESSRSLVWQRDRWRNSCTQRMHTIEIIMPLVVIRHGYEVITCVTVNYHHALKIGTEQCGLVESSAFMTLQQTHASYLDVTHETSRVGIRAVPCFYSMTPRHHICTSCAKDWLYVQSLHDLSVCQNKTTILALPPPKKKGSIWISFH